jgi:Peptidase propeptide and YPEB domain
MSSVPAPEATDRLASDDEQSGNGHASDPRMPAAIGAMSAARRTRPPQPVWLRVALIAGLLVLTFVVARSCQQSQVRITQEQAIATAERRVPFEPTHVQVRMLRQGVTSRPFWIVSLSVPREEEPQVFDELAVVRVDANTGKVEDVRIQRDAPQPGEG